MKIFSEQVVEQKAEQIERLIRTYFEGCNEANIDKIVSCFVSDAVHYFPPGMYGGPFQGAQMIAEKWCDAVKNLGSHWTIDRMLIDPVKNEAAIEWSHFKSKQNKILRGDEWYIFDPKTGLIREIRAYYASPQSPEFEVLQLEGYDYKGNGYPSSHPQCTQGGGFTWIDGCRIPMDDVAHLPPVIPTKIVCVHLNYRSRLDELKRKQPPAPAYFWKPVSCLIGHRGKVICPQNCQYLNYEGEFALVVGRTTRNIRPDQAADYILGYTIANDLSLHDFRDTDENSMVRVKGSDTLGSVGPVVKTDWDFRGKKICTYVDGKIVQHDTTDGLLWDPHYVLADLSRSITFEPGDLIFLGTPANSRPVGPGSTVVVEVEGLGRLVNEIVAAEFGVATEYGAQPSSSEGVMSIALGTDYKPKS